MMASYIYGKLSVPTWKLPDIAWTKMESNFAHKHIEEKSNWSTHNDIVIKQQRLHLQPIRDINQNT